MVPTMPRHSPARKTLEPSAVLPRLSCAIQALQPGMMLLALSESLSAVVAVGAGADARKRASALRASTRFLGERQNIALSMLHAQNGNDWASSSSSASPLLGCALWRCVGRQ